MVGPLTHPAMSLFCFVGPVMLPLASLYSQPGPRCAFMRPTAVLVHDPPSIAGQLEPCLAMDWLHPGSSVFLASA